MEGVLLSDGGLLHMYFTWISSSFPIIQDPSCLRNHDLGTTSAIQPEAEVSREPFLLLI